MTSPDDARDIDDIEADDATLAASDDVVAQIRAHAARVRRGEVAADEGLDVWTATPAPADRDVVDLTADAGNAADAGRRFVGDADRLLLPNDETVAFSALVPDGADAAAVAEAASPASPATPPSQPVAGSLIAGLEPPDVTATFWTADKPFRASGIDFGPRHRTGVGLPMWVLVTIVAAVIIVASIGIAVVVASTGPLA